MKKSILLVAVILFLASCSPRYRLHRLLKKHPELTRIDTIKIKDSVIVPGTNIDTVFHSSVLHDTITISKEKLQIKFIEKNDTIYINAKVEPDTIVIEREIPVQRVLDIEPEKWWVRWWWVLVLIGLIFVFIVLVLKI